MEKIKRLIQYLIKLPDRAINYLRFRIKGIKVGKGFVCHGSNVYLYGGKRINIGKNCLISSGRKRNPLGFGNGCSIVAQRTGRITIGDYLGMSNCTLFSRKSIRIGNHVMLGDGVKILDTDFHSLDYSLRGTAQDLKMAKCGEINIQDHVFIGAGSIILKGVTIGERAVIGAGSVVTKDIPVGEIWGGNPARFIRKVKE